MSFEKIIGNEKIKKYLIQSIEEKNILHSYLFLGTDGIGKFLFAKEFAKYILCKESKISDCACKSCICFDTKNHPDFSIINESGDTIKVEYIREVIEKIIEKPIVSDRKVYIINACEKMTKEAQNCLLKTLEEPPEFVTIILISANENLILNTIKSRCASIKFNSIEKEDLEKYITDNLEYQNLTENLLKYFDGSIGKAINTQDKEEDFLEIERIIKSVNEKDLIDFMQPTKILYDKENIFEYLNYIIVCLYEEAKYNKNFLNCIKYVNECITRLKANGYLDMNVDILLFNIWGEINENSSRS